MSEVKRISVFIHGPNKAIDMVEAVHLDRVTAKRDAALAEVKTQTLRADAAVGDANEAERNLANWKRKACESAEREHELQQRLTAADDRVGELLIMLRMAWVDTEVSGENCRRIDAALKPAEGGGDGN